MTDAVKMAKARHALSEHEQMADAQAQCVPCKLCGGSAVITDAGIGAGYNIRCSGSTTWRPSNGCMVSDRRLGGWAYNVMEWWNRLNSTAALEQAGEPVDAALLDRAELAWQRFFYPAADCFTGPTADKLPSVDLEVADCLRLVLAAVGRLVVTPEADVPAPLATLQRLGQEFDAGEELSTLLTKAIGDITVALTWAGKSGKIEEWTAPYVAAVNQFDAQTQSRVAAEPVGLREAKASFKTALADLGKRDAVHWWGTDDSQHAERMKACKARCKRWGDCDEEDGSCAECDSDMAEALETRGSMKRRLRNYEARVDRFFQSDGLRAAQAALATPSQRDPQSRGQAFDGEGEGWRPIESAPKDGTEIILFGPYPENSQGIPTDRVTAGFWTEPEPPVIGDCGGECRCPEYGEPEDPHWCSMHGGSDEGWMSTDGGFTREWPPTHWMPLPDFPALSSAKRGEG